MSIDLARIKLYETAPIFQDLPPDILKDVDRHFAFRQFQAHEFLFLEGEQATTYYLIYAGRVKIVQTSFDGEQVILHMLGPGDIVGALPTLGKGTYPGSAQAMEPVEAGFILAAGFEDLMCQYPRICINLLNFATEKLQETHRRLKEMSTERVERRIARTLTRLAAKVGHPIPKGVLIDAPISRQDLAEMTGTTLYTVSRTLKAWERAGILMARRLQVTILDPHKLATIGEDLPVKEG